MIDLIPKKEQKPIFGQVFFSIVSVAMLFAVAAAFFVFQQLAHNAREVLEVLEKRFVEDTRPLEEELAVQLQFDKKKTEILRGVLDERGDILGFFGFLEQTTHPGVTFQGLTGDVKTGAFLLTGRAQSFSVLEQQRLVWEKQQELSVMLRGITLDEGGQGGFEVEFALEPKVFDSP